MLMIPETLGSDLTGTTVISKSSIQGPLGEKEEGRPERGKESVHTHATVTGSENQFFLVCHSSLCWPPGIIVSHTCHQRWGQRGRWNG